MEWVQLVQMYESRSTSRVADVSSVVLRDAIIWLFFGAFLGWKGIDRPDWKGHVQKITSCLGMVGSPFDEDQFSKRLIQEGWGRL
jgi:hypothetical protein